MIIRQETVINLAESVQKLEDYYKDIRSLYEFIDIRFRIPEYGVALTSVYNNNLVSNASGYKLSDDSSYPFYLWTPSWLGRFYIDITHVSEKTAIQKCKWKDVKCMAFVWSWLGVGDAYVADQENRQPECWIGISAAESNNPDESVDRVADMMFKHFRFESSCTGEFDDWLTGQFSENNIGCTLSGEWYLKRIPLASLSSFYAVNNLIVRPLGEKYSHLTKREKCHVNDEANKADLYRIPTPA